MLKQKQANEATTGHKFPEEKKTEMQGSGELNDCQNSGHRPKRLFVMVHEIESVSFPVCVRQAPPP
jgi:hypothetical protein